MKLLSNTIWFMFILCVILAIVTTVSAFLCNTKYVLYSLGALVIVIGLMVALVIITSGIIKVKEADE